MIQFPCLIYKAPGPIIRARYTYSSKAVATQEELDRSLAQGWHMALGEALEAAGPRAARVSRVRPKPPRKPSQPFVRVRAKAKAEKPVAAVPAPAVAVSVETPTPVENDSDAPTRIELVEKANQLGLKFSKRTSDEKLLAMITEALSKQEA